MLNIGPLELLLIFLIALVVVGPKKLPDLGRTIGRGLREFRKAQDEVRQSLQLDELRDVKRDIADTQRGVRDALRFDTATPRAERPTPNGEPAADAPAPEPSVTPESTPPEPSVTPESTPPEPSVTPEPSPEPSAEPE